MKELGEKHYQAGCDLFGLLLSLGLQSPERTMLDWENDYGYLAYCPDCGYDVHEGFECETRYGSEYDDEASYE